MEERMNYLMQTTRIPAELLEDLPESERELEDIGRPKRVLLAELLDPLKEG